MPIQTNYHNGVLTISPDQVFDLSLYEPLETIYHQFCEKTTQAIVDLSHIEFMDSGSLGLLLMLKEELGSSLENIRIINAKEEVIQVLQMAHFHHFFEIL